ncbi:POK6 protein, partial [Pteruthius melanotis]|nr:POK6 protein [Pteruthius melanotis]
SGFPQTVELAAVVHAFQKWATPFNLITDSAYVTGIIERAEAAILREVSNVDLFQWLQQLIFLLDFRQHPYFVMHVCSHTTLLGFIAEGNQQVDLLTLLFRGKEKRGTPKTPTLSHSFSHRIAAALPCTFALKHQQVQDIIAACPDCRHHNFVTGSPGINPRGLQSLQVWQADVTHYPEFGRLKYVHSSIDTFSGALFASCHTGETAGDVSCNFLAAFAVLEIPQQIKTDNDPAYTSQRLSSFFTLWGISHITGIPHCPTGQANIEHAHSTLKHLLAQQ